MFPFRSFLYNFTLEPCVKLVISRKKQWTATQNIGFISKQPCILSLYFFVSPIKYNVQPCTNQSSFFLNSFSKTQLLKWSVHDTFIPPPFHFLMSCYLLRSPDNSNLFQFPLKGRVIGSRLYLNFSNSLIIHN